MLEAKNISKIFKIPYDKRDSVRENVLNLLKPVKHKTFKALSEINFRVEEGEWVGLIGANGSGKSTLLKILAGVYEPNTGEISRTGKLVPFLELGVGFNPELSARDNIYLNGILMGMTKKEVDLNFTEIVEFAEIRSFLDAKLKNFSSGMQVRLAFSIAIMVDADIYLLDEILAVGDISFQEKCKNVFKELKKKNKTVILVSHDLSAIDNLCTRAIWVEKGKIKKIGDSATVTNQFWKQMLRNQENDRR